ncbi:HNH endonuclease [Trichocoleus sp. FACHB-591]|uniref:HNH endonuclease n=1 Tax=Trichocoleus sp. FACHB-591 TaxID=2692872 RepID=UPI0016894440|nr:HNH endonuclease [Trichocoleus sp. FACHB-591]MBD2094466.1 HNH endonuclease [Trichocoleus sp. FACHB-591]
MSSETNNLTPGEQIKEILKELYPFKKKELINSFLMDIDNALMAEGKYLEITYESNINYFLRRLISTAQYIFRKYNPKSHPSDKYIQEIRKFLTNSTRIPERKVGKILVLLLECIRESKREPSDTLRKNLLQEADNQGKGCYICGSNLDFSSKNNENSAIIEHVWPRAMGGDSEPRNLRVSCKRCSEIKENYIDACDFHYEKICLVNHDKSKEAFSKEFNWVYRIAVVTKSRYRCIVCGKEPAYEGVMEFCRQEDDDSWHFLNIGLYCSKHSQE